MRSTIEEAWDQIFLLALFASSKEPLDNLKIQKVVFISEDEARKNQLLAAHFPFYRNKFGPYSPLLANDVRKLEDWGFIYPETRQPTDRGKYLLEYVADGIQESRTASTSLEILAATQKKYQDMGSFALKDAVYEMRVSVVGLKGTVMAVKEIPMRTTILHPALERLNDSASLPNDLLDDICVELSLTREDLDPDSPANIEIARESLARALGD